MASLQHTITNLKDLLNKITQDLGKAEGGNKAAAQRVRTMSVRFEKVAKSYRKESISSEKNNKGVKRTAKKAAKPKAKPAAKAKPMKMKAKPKAKTAAMAKPRALSFKKPTAKLPMKSSWK